MIFRFAAAALLACTLATNAGAADIQLYERGLLAKIRSEHAGKHLVVHYWSLTCLPCMVEMPKLASFLRENRDIDIVFVAADPVEQSERIASRLERFGLKDAMNFAFADGFVERLYYEVDKGWRGELPFTLMVSPDGATKTHLGEIDPQMLRRWRDGG